MKKAGSKPLILMVCVLFAFIAATAFAATELAVVTGGQKGNYFKAAANISDLMKKTDASVRFAVKPQQVKGSTDMLKFMVSQSLPLAIAQSNVVDREFSAGMGSLRVVIALFPEEKEGPNVYATRADVPEETIYELTKFLMENKTKLGILDSNIKKADWTTFPCKRRGASEST